LALKVAGARLGICSTHLNTGWKSLPQ